MSFVLRFRSRAAVWLAPALLASGCAVAAPALEDDPFFEKGDEEDAGDLDAAMIDPSVVDPEPMDSGSVLPPFSGGSAGGTAGGAAGGTTGGVMTARDAGAGARDASTGGPRDASAGRPTTPARDAAAPTTGCNVLTCTNECSVAGPFPCCTLLDTCGCTWAPGAYCL
jgi:hypothetical protein